MKLDHNLIDNVKVEGVEFEAGSETPDFVDAFVASANYGGRPMTADELDALNSSSEIQTFIKGKV